MIRYLVLIVILYVGTSQAQTKQVRCEDVSDLSLAFIGVHRSCIMTDTTVIDARDYNILSSKDDDMGALNFWSNKKISYLPIDAYKSFPNLVMMDVGHCTLKEISKPNFRNLGKLRELLMCCNQIERVDGDTFEDSPLLEYIGLDKNKIKTIGERTFVGLNKLKIVWLEQNICISIYFGDEAKLKTLNREVAEKCGASSPVSLLTGSNQIFCEKTDFTYMHFVGSPNTCILTDTTKIDGKEFKFVDTKDDSLQALKFWGNKRISYLPIEIHKTFKNLISIDAGQCAIKEISKASFQNLRKMKVLLMCCNLIERIDGDTFNGLTSLEYLGLDGNNIATVGDGAFKDLKSLTTLWLEKNDCINEHFGDANKLATVNQVVAEKCSSNAMTTEVSSSNFECGIVTLIQGQSIGGTETKRGQWPFLVALHNIEKQKFFCGGNLISAKHVLTAAHCINDKDSLTKLTADEIVVQLGRYDLKSKVERGSTQREVTEVIINPNWKIFTKKWDSDLAILVLSYPVRFTSYIQPVCLPTANTDTFIDGYVVGWGKSEFSGPQNYESIPRQVNLTVVDPGICLSRDTAIASISSENTFCAGGEGAGPCTGDSGGGFFVYTGSFWSIRGLVSVAKASGDFKCGHDSFSVYTHVSKFTNWIQDVMRNN